MPDEPVAMAARARRVVGARAAGFTHARGAATAGFRGSLTVRATVWTMEFATTGERP